MHRRSSPSCHVPSCHTRHHITRAISGAADATDSLLFSPCDPQMRAKTNAAVFEPIFTYHGFRYASLADISQLWWMSPQQLCDDIMAGKIVEARVLASDLKEGGHVTMSSNDWEAIERACVWSSRSNLMGVPTDCPQRDVSIMRFEFDRNACAACRFCAHCDIYAHTVCMQLRVTLSA